MSAAAAKQKLVAVGKKMFKHELDDSLGHLVISLDPLASATSLSDFNTHITSICRFADLCRHFVLFQKDTNPKPGSDFDPPIEVTICSSRAHSALLLAATRQALLLLTAEAGPNPVSPLHRVSAQEIWCVQRLCEIVTDVFYCFWSRLQRQEPDKEQGVWREVDKMHSNDTRRIASLTCETGGHCVVGVGVGARHGCVRSGSPGGGGGARWT